MAVNAAKVRELPRGRATGATERGREHTRAYLVTMLTKADGSHLARIADDGITAIPAVGSLHPQDEFARVVNVSVDATDDFLNYNVNVEYSTQSNFAGFTLTTGSQDLDYQVDNPLNRPWRYSFGLRSIERPIEKAWRVVSDADIIRTWLPGLQQQAVLNSAGMPFDPPLMGEDYVQTMTVSRWESSSTYTPVKALLWADCINHDTWSMATNINWPKWTARVAGISATAEHIAGYWWWNVTYELEFKWNTWLRRPLDSGWSYIEGDQRLAFRDADDEILASPGLLNGTGGKLPEGQEPLFKTYLANRTADFTTLFNY